MSTPRALVNLVMGWLRNPPDLVERSPAVRFVISVFPDRSAGISASKLVGATPQEITAMTQVAFDILIQWARSQGVQIQMKGTPPPAQTPAKNPLLEVRP